MATKYAPINIPTPQDVLAQLQAQRMQMIGSGDRVLQTQAVTQQAMDAIFGNPAVRKAQEVQSRIQRATAEITPTAGESDIDTELRRLTAMRDGLVDKFPDVATQINEQMLQLGQIKMERDKLRQDTFFKDQENTRANERERREGVMHNVKMREIADKEAIRTVTGGNTYVLDPSTGKAQAFDLFNPNEMLPFRRASAAPGAMVISQEQAFQLYRDETEGARKLREAMAKADSEKGMGKIEARHLRESAGGLSDLYATAERIFDVLSVNPDALTKASAGGKQLDRVATELAASARVATGGVTTEGRSIDSWMKANSITNTRMQGLVVGLAYASARAQDPNGRISDKDLEAAYRMIGGDNPNPAALLSNLNDTLTMRTNALEDRLGFLEGAEGVAEPIRKTLDPRKKSFNDKFRKWASGSRASATGVETPAPAPKAPTKTLDQRIDDILK